MNDRYALPLGKKTMYDFCWFISISKLPWEFYTSEGKVGILIYLHGAEPYFRS
jgi:hypothetical protein